ncbi:MAG: coiled-coil domain-containing protein [Planctomycetota bacterium]|jgi:hypothetical protein
MTRAATAGVLLALLACAACPNDSDLIEVEGAQREVGYVCAQTAVGYDLLREEYEINFGPSETRDAARLNQVLREVAEGDVPAVIDHIREITRAADGRSDESIGAAEAGQQTILEKLRGLLSVETVGLSARMIAQRTAALIEAQRELERETRDRAVETLGKRLEELTAEEKASAEELSTRQKHLATEVADLQTAVESLTSRPADLRADPRVEGAARSGLLEAAETEMRGSASSLAENRGALALLSQEEAIEKLEAFKRALEGRTPVPDPAATLKALAEEQEQLRHDTAEAKGAEGLEVAAARQGRLGEKTTAFEPYLQNSPLAARFARAAGEAMADASASAKRAALDSEQRESLRQEALSSQQRAQELLEGASVALANPGLENALAATEASAAEVFESARAIAGLEDLIDKQEGLHGETAQTVEDAPRLAEISGGQQEIAEELDDLRSEHGPRLTPEGEEGSLDEAGAAMQSASESLGQARGQEALEDQGRALASLRQARRGLMQRALAQGENFREILSAARRSGLPDQLPPDLASAVQRWEDTAGTLDDAARALALAGDEKDLADSLGRRTSADSSLNEATAVAQEGLAARASQMALAEGAPREFAAAASEAEGEMREASGFLRGGQPVEALGRMQSAAGLLESAAAHSVASVYRGRGHRGPSPGRDGTGIAPGNWPRAGTPGAAPTDRAWAAKLPPGTPGDIMQAAQGALPRGYEGALRRYYESLARERPGD